jgi:hypothetical protein
MARKHRTTRCREGGLSEAERLQHGEGCQAWNAIHGLAGESDAQQQVVPSLLMDENERERKLRRVTVLQDALYHSKIRPDMFTEQEIYLWTNELDNLLEELGM